MNEAKVPDSKADWQAIDIYLFSNGQQYTPPRKYHLQTEELTWWESTLNYLARSQFGYMHSSINLYTVDGKRLEGPLELSDGIAYVAVETNDTFIPAGYDLYLMKASRSWEKRQAKNLSNNEVRNPDEIQMIHNRLKSDIKVRLDKLKSNLRPTAETLNIHSIDETEAVKTLISPAHTHGERSSIASSKRRLPLSQRNTIARKINTTPLTSPAASRKSSLKKREFSAKLYKVASKNEKSPTGSINNHQQPTTKSNKIIAKNVCKGKQTMPTTFTASSKIKDPVETKLSSSTKPQSNEKGHTINKTEVDNIINDKEITMVSNINISVDSKTDSILVDSELNRNRFSVIDNKDKSDTSLTAILMPNDNRQTIETIEELPPTIINKILENMHVPESLNIELFSDKLQTNGSQTNVDENVVMQNQTLQTIFSELNKSENNEKNVLVHCARCHVAPACYDKMKFVVLVLNKSSNENFLRCNCGEANCKVDKEVQTTQNIKVNCNESIDKIKTNISPIRNFDSTETKDIVHINNNKITEYVKTSPSSPYVSKNCNKNEFTKRKVVISERENRDPVFITALQDISTEEIQAAQSLILENEVNHTRLTKSTLNKYTQTEWCNIMLEARRHEDGHYTFHLPPLQVLRYYSL
ncbi:uncharacterized protein LOC131844542 [Achroia grisella]|uniref:uncharacterized protein LOC131844542 n=1 Tax=Achroia grisella TaxID=688607 RepID=UPI0027D32DE0|nr:uncharacterized protein LOC131844542 [Achroia grisella]